MAAGAGADTPFPTRVEILAPLMQKEQLQCYLRADTSVRTLRSELPQVFDRPLTADIYATNVSLGGDILGGTVATGRDEYLAFFNNLRRLQSLSLVLRVASVDATVDATGEGTEAADLNAAVTVRFEWGVTQRSQLLQLPGGDLLVAQLQSVLKSIQNQQRDLALSVRLRLAVDTAGRIGQVAVEQVLLLLRPHTPGPKPCAPDS
jgi:hypothetical protein